MENNDWLNCRYIQDVIMSGDTDSALKMIKSGKWDLSERDPDAGDTTILMRAVDAGDQDVFNCLLEMNDQLTALNAGINALSEGDYTALDLARDGDQQEMVETLLKYGAKTGEEVLEEQKSLLGGVKQGFEKFCSQQGYASDEGTLGCIVIRGEDCGKSFTVKAYSEDTTSPFPTFFKQYLQALRGKCDYLKIAECDSMFTVTLPADKRAACIAALSGAEPEKVSLSKVFNVVFTGTLSTTRAEAAAQAEALGFKVSDAVSKNVDYLIAGNQPGSKVEKAKKLNIPVLSEAEWKKLSAPKGP